MSQNNPLEIRFGGRVRAAIALSAGLCLAAPAAAFDTTPTRSKPTTATQKSQPVAGTFIVNTTMDSTDAAIGDGICADAAGNCSVRAAFQEANASPDRIGIRLRAGTTYPLTLGGAGEDAAATGDLDVTGNIDLDGRGATINAMGIDRAIDVLMGAALHAHNVNITNGALTDDSGAGYRSAGSLLIQAGSITNSAALGAGASGGGVFNSGGNLFVMGVTIQNCSATRAGGAIEANAGRTDIRGSQMIGNDTGPMPGNGGAFHLTGMGRVDIRGSFVEGNTAANEGGGLWNSGSGRMTVSRTVVSRNAALGEAADTGGGGLFNDGGYLEVSDSTVMGNTATEGSGSGGGLFNNQGVLRIKMTQITNNSSNRAGGGIEALAGSTDVWGGQLSRNDTGASPGNGGGLHLTGAGFVSFKETEVKGNTASAEGGGLWNSAVGTMIVQGVNVENNTASGDPADQGGGGLFNDGGFLLVKDSRVAMNEADGAAGSGGGLFNNAGDLEIVNTIVAANSSNRAGGGVEAREGVTRLETVTLQDNTTGPSPGNGGGLHLTGAGEVYVDASRVKRNDASNEGGGLWNSSTGLMIVNNTSFFANTSPVGADLFNVTGGTLLVDGVAVTGGQP